MTALSTMSRHSGFQTSHHSKSFHHSSTSQCSLRSNSVVNPSQFWKACDVVGKKQTQKTSWPHDHMLEFIHFLAFHHAASGDNNFKAVTYSEAAAHLNKIFLVGSDGVMVAKTASSCSTKWNGVQWLKQLSQYLHVLH